MLVDQTQAMAAPSIPNLNSLGSRGGPRLRGRGRGRAIPENSNDLPPTAEEQAAARDEIVQQTDNDASSSRMSAVELGYLDDRYARSFIPQGKQVPRRYPIINRGTYVRTTAIDTLVQRFLRHEPQARKQIISLGAGSDTRYFRLCANLEVSVVYHELDFPQNIEAKKTAISRSDEMSAALRPQTSRPSEYHMHSLDLRTLATDSTPDLPHLEADTPTLLLSECCLCYLPPDSTTSILRYFTSRINGPLALVLYEPIRPHDAFGRTMVTNLASRGIHMQTLKRYSTLATQRVRLRLSGLTNGQGARDVYQLWQDTAWVSQGERDRIDKLEWLDEVEEWKLLATHYCVAWGWRGDLFSAAWSGLEGGWTVDEVADNDMV